MYEMVEPVEVAKNQLQGTVGDLRAQLAEKERDLETSHKARSQAEF